MRFRFCGDLDCPDWVLAEIATLSKISSVRLKVVAKQVVQHILSGSMDYSKVLKLAGESLTGISDVKGAIAGLKFILSAGAKYDVDDNTLLQEIQQLGLPKENAEAVVKTFHDHKEQLRTAFLQQSFQLDRFESLDWRVDHVLQTSQQAENKIIEPETVVQLKLSLKTRRVVSYCFLYSLFFDG